MNASIQGAYYLTTPIYYVNAEPHIGHTYTTVVADMLARHYRLRGRRTFLLTGSDEHGEKVLEVAKSRGETPAETAAYYATKFRETWDELGITYDRFIRTTDPDHKAVVQQILQQVWESGQLEFQEYEGDYCIGCERFLSDRDLVDGLCRDHERAPERRAEGNYFFKMSEHFDWLAGYIDEHPDFIRPQRYRNEVLSMLKDESGLGDLCISRPKSRLDWGIELPFDDLSSFPVLAVDQGFTDTINDKQTGFRDRTNLFGEPVTPLAEQVAAFPVTDDDMGASGFFHHGHRYLAGERSFKFLMGVLGAEHDSGAGDRLGHRKKKLRGGADEHLDTLDALDALGNTRDKRPGFRQRLMHFPITGDKRRSHAPPPFSMLC